jgi:hypothetical protein
MFCQNCGNEVSDKAVVCVKCGCALKPSNFAEVTAPVDGKDWLTTLLLCVFLGGFGIHRFYTGSTGIGVVQLLTLGGCGIWALIDFIMILTGAYKDGEGRSLVRR